MRYARLSDKKAPSLLRFMKASYAFMNKYFIRLGFLDGLTGLNLAFIYAKYTYIKYSPKSYL